MKCIYFGRFTNKIASLSIERIKFDISFSVECIFVTVGFLRRNISERVVRKKGKSFPFIIYVDLCFFLTKRVIIEYFQILTFESNID